MLATSLKDRLTFDLFATWQARCIKAATGKTATVLMSVLSHNYEESSRLLYDLVYGEGFIVAAPYLESAGRIAKNGAIIAKVRGRDGSLRWMMMYGDELALRDDFRRLADQLKLNDADRVELFAAVKRWVVADRRLDPAMDPRDPDAKRLN